MKTAKTTRKPRTVADLAARLETSIEALATAKPAKARKAPRFDRKHTGPAAPARKAKLAPAPAPAPVEPAPVAPARRMSLVGAAVVILQRDECQLPVREILRRITESGLWSSPAGKTPEQTLYSAIIREIATKGTDARFRRGDQRGAFLAA
jgi:hypothetical protein